MSTSLEMVLNATTQHVHLTAQVKPTRVARWPRYVGNRADGISHWIKDKRVCSIGENAARDIGSSTCVDHAADGSGRYVAQRNWQANLLHPGVGSGSKLPDVGDPDPVGNVKPAQNVELIVARR